MNNMIGKLNYKRLLLLAALPAFMLASCTQEEMGDSPDAQNGEISFEIGFASQNEAIQTDAQTRVATDTQFNSTWENGDEIGIFAAPHGTELLSSGNFIHNVKLTYTNGKWTAEEGIYWPKDGTKYDFYAYYPYDAAATDPTSMAFSVDADQSESTNEKSNYNLSDLLMAKTTKADGYGKGETVKLAFTHALAMVQVNVSKSMIGDYPADMLKVWLNGCSTDCKLNLSTQSATLPADSAFPVKIKMYPCPNDGYTPGIYAYRALVPVRTIAKSTVLFSFEYDGSTLLRSEPLAEPVSLKAGVAEKFDITFPFTTVVATATVSSSVRLAGLFTLEELNKITHLKVMGEMTQADFYTIRDKMNNITNLDLSGARVVGDVDTGGSNIVQGNAIPTEAFWEKKSLQKFTFPSGITSIGSFAFYYCSNLTGPLNIPEGVTTICYGAFLGCSSITGTLILPAHLTRIEEGAFNQCSNLTGPLNIPAGIQTIDHNVFNGCSGITSLTIPASITSIGARAFYKCEKLTEITSLIVNPNNVTYSDEIFGAVPADNITLYVPVGTKSLYTSHDIWSPFKNIKELPAKKTIKP